MVRGTGNLPVDKHMQAGRELAAALMEGFLAASEAQEQDTFPYLLVRRLIASLCVLDVIVTLWQHSCIAQNMLMRSSQLQVQVI